METELVSETLQETFALRFCQFIVFELKFRLSIVNLNKALGLPDEDLT